MGTSIKQIIKRNGELQNFDPNRIFRAIEKAFLSENLNDAMSISSLTHEVIIITENHMVPGSHVSVEKIQDVVEEVLMNNGYHTIARNFILYRAEHKKVRQEKVLTQIKEKTLKVKVSETDSIIFSPTTIEEGLRQLAPDLMRISITEMVEAVTSQIYDNIPQKEIELLILGAARDRIEQHYEYSYLASRISLNNLYKRVLESQMNSSNFKESYHQNFHNYIQKGIELEMLTPEFQNYDLEKIIQAIDPSRDQLFMYLGSQIVQDRYLLRDRSKEKYIFELPQWFWMRVSMGLALKEDNREERAIEFYNVLSKFELVSSTPTLFNSGTLHSQMSSCYLNVAEDSLDHIFKLYADNAQLSKWAGGIGTDWTSIRATGSKIKGTNGKSQGVIPFLKIFNDVALAVNQGGKRKGAMCAYMELWHLDYEQFLELKKNTGDERRRAHDINTASWIPDLFMKRVQQNGNWTFFCPSDVPDLHDLYGQAFEKQYEMYESQKLPRAKTIKAVDLWRRMLTMLYETGHPWITFKDAANVRNPQDHAGVIHSSNLCTEITLNTSKNETAVCNLASINLASMIENGDLNEEKIARTVRTGIRMLDNVIDNNYYPTKEAENANTQHRAIGLGMMGYQDALFQLDYAFDSDENVTFSDRSMEMVSYYAILASSELAKEREPYKTFIGSKWERGLLPIDTLDLLEKERGQSIKVNRNRTMDWSIVRDHVKKFGMRNSNTMAIAPTATIANITGVYPCTEPVFKNIYMKENLSGNFIVMNKYMIDDLEKLGLWDQSTIRKIKLHNGSILEIDEIPQHIRNKYKETFEIDMKWIMQTSATRAKWIDQSASTNVFMNTKSGKALSETYMMAWEMGLKTTYYLRSLAASQVMKATVGETQEHKTIGGQAPKTEQKNAIQTEPLVCSILDPDCEACQ